MNHIHDLLLNDFHLLVLGLHNHFLLHHLFHLVLDVGHCLHHFHWLHDHSLLNLRNNLLHHMRNRHHMSHLVSNIDWQLFLQHNRHWDLDRVDNHSVIIYNLYVLNV